MKRQCCTCEHLDQTGNSHGRRCLYKGRHYIFSPACSRYRYMFAKDLFGEMTYSKLIREGKILDATGTMDAIDYRFNKKQRIDKPIL